MIFYDMVLAAIVLGGAALNIVAVSCSGAPCRTSRSVCRPSKESFFRRPSVGLQSIETLKATAGEDDFFSKWGGYHARAINSEQRLAMYQGAISCCRRCFSA